MGGHVEHHALDVVGALRGLELAERPVVGQRERPGGDAAVEHLGVLEGHLRALGDGDLRSGAVEHLERVDPEQRRVARPPLGHGGRDLVVGRVAGLQPGGLGVGSGGVGVGKRRQVGALDGHLAHLDGGRGVGAVPGVGAGLDLLVADLVQVGLGGVGLNINRLFGLDALLLVDLSIHSIFSLLHIGQFFSLNIAYVCAVAKCRIRRHERNRQHYRKKHVAQRR